MAEEQGRCLLEDSISDKSTSTPYLKKQQATPPFVTTRPAWLVGSLLAACEVFCAAVGPIASIRATCVVALGGC